MTSIGTASQASDNFRLPRDVTPLHYAVTIKTYLDTLTFEGTSIVDLRVNQATTCVTLHALSPLKVIRAALTCSALKTSIRHEAQSIEVDEKSERVMIRFGDVARLQQGATAKLALAFKGDLEASMMGYYKSTFDVEGSNRHYALTQFEPTAARRGFPCWDEPAIKATVQLTLISKKGTTSLSNMPAIDTFDSDGFLPFPLSDEGTAATDKGPMGVVKGPMASSAWEVTRFEATPKISTYLVAWANGEFASLESSYVSPVSGKRVPLKIYATADHIHQAQFALDIKAKVLPIYERLFDVAYPLPKLDTLIASDFDAGAMENWGLITGRTSVYLYDEAKSGIAARKRTAGVQSHEVSHQWFGNIVTMEWWDNLWLNEAFATLMGEVIVIHELFPEWRVHSSFINEHLKRALTLDSLRSSHPIEMPCPDSAMINQIFDAISYSKGASVLKMLANMMGEKTFLKGVSIYLKKHLYGNSRTSDLWAGVSEASGLDVAKIMGNWTLKVGFPVVTVDEESDGLRVRQNRFLSTGDTRTNEDETLWYIPLELKTIGSDGKVRIHHDAVLNEQRETFIPFPNVQKAVYKLNAETAGVYRVRYSPQRLAQLGEEAARTGGIFTVNDRMGLVQDAYLLAKSGQGDTSGALNLLSKLSAETENLVWTEIDGATSEISSVWWEQPDMIREGLYAFRRTLFRPVLARLGFDPKKGESSDDAELRRTAVSALVGAEDTRTIEEIQRRFRNYMDQDDDQLIPGDLRQIMFIAAASNGGNAEYDKIVSVYTKAPTPQYKIAAMLALCYGATPELRQKTQDMILSGKVKEQDMMYASLCAFYSELVATRNKNHFEEMSRRFTGNFSFSRLVQYSIDSLTTHEDAKAVEDFFADKDCSAFNQSLQQGLDAVRTRAGWLQRSAKDVEEWLTINHYLPQAKA